VAAAYRRAGATRRQWGWHPLRPDWARTVVADALVRPGDLVLDLGAGTGELTRPLLEAGARVVAVELHPGRVRALRETFGRTVTVVHADLRDLRLPRQPFRVVASPPYQLTTDVVATLMGSERLLSADLVLQRSAVRRLATAPPGGRHARRYRLEVGRPVPRSAFSPPPRVDSAVLRVRRR
jgi:23S rRNA (adenine-N6)-dimethyltransferase